MTDISKLSDDELARLKRARQQGSQRPVNIDQLSDQMLLDLARKRQGERDAAQIVERATAGPTMNERVNAFTGGAIDLPIIGPALQGGAQRMGAGVRSMIYDTPYADELKFVQDETSRIKQENPKTYMGGQMAGTAAALAPVAATETGAQMLGLTGNLGSRVTASGLTGGFIGGADAAARGGDLKDVAAGTGAGMIIGGGIPLAGAAIGSGSRYFLDMLRRAPAPTRKVAEALMRDGLSPEQAARRLLDLGDDAMIADLGPNLQRQAGAIAANPGKGQSILENAIRARQAGATARVQSGANRALGQSRNIVQNVDDMIANQRQAAAPLYDAAYKTPIKVTQPIRDVLDTPAGRAAMTRARRMAANEGVNANVSTLDTRMLDYVKRSLDDQIGVAKRQGANQQARALMGLKNKLVSELDNMNPTYAKARQTFAGDAAIIDAMDEGQAVFKRSLSPDQLYKQMAGMSKGERDAFKTGARAQLDEIMGTARNDANAAKAMFEKGWNREKLALVVGKREAEEFMNVLDAEKAFQLTAHRVTQNSETAARQAAQMDLGMRAGAGGPQTIVGRAMESIPGAGPLVRGSVNRVAEAMRGNQQAGQQATMAELLSTTGPARQKAIDQIAKALALRASAERVGLGARTASQLLMQGGAPLVRDPLAGYLRGPK